MKNKIKHLGIIRLSAMGDVAMTVPVLLAFVAQYPDVKVTFVSRASFKPFFEDINNVDFFAFDPKERHKGFLGLMRLKKDINNLGIDAFLDLHNVLRSKIVSFLFRLSFKKTAQIDKGRKDKRKITALKPKEIKPLKTVFERQQDAYASLGFPIDLSKPYFKKKNTIEDLLSKIPFDTTKNNIGIAPFAQYDSKIYPIDLMQNLINELCKNTKNQIYLFGGGAKEIAMLNQLATENSSIIIAGKINLKEELSLIAHLSLMISMDSGNSHIASMLGVKVLTLWGATHPFTGFKPYNQPYDYCLTADRNQFPFLPTSVYGNKLVEGYEDAMRSISVDDILEKCNSFFQHEM